MAAFYRDRFGREGWSLVRETMTDASPVLLLDRRGSRLEVVVVDVDGLTIAVLNEVDVDE